MSITKEGIEVKVGQVWRDLDTRMAARYCRVKDLGYTGTCGTIPAAVMQVCRPNGATVTERITKVRISRMHHHSTGWDLVRDVA